MEASLFNAAIQGFLNLLHLKVFLAMMIGVSIGTFTAVAPQGLGMPLVYAIALPVVIRWEPITGIALLIGASSASSSSPCRSRAVCSTASKTPCANRGS
jgi:TctA family transporter